MGLNWRAGIDPSQQTSLVASGICRLSRNPAFVGFDLLYIGITMSYPNILTVITTVIAIALFHIQILREEKFMLAKFGSEYTEYRDRTLRY